jgi:hypothetical protein
MMLPLSHEGPDSLNSYARDIALNVFAPAFRSLLTVCIVGLLYELIMKRGDRIGLHNIVYGAVRTAIFGRDSLSHPELQGQQGRLSDVQILAKDKLRDLVKEDHQERLRQFDRQNILKIHEFGEAWKILIHNTFINGEDLLDFSIGSNAMFKFQAYQFTNYYSNLILERRKHSSSPSKVRIMILCDDISWHYGETLTRPLISSPTETRQTARC